VYTNDWQNIKIHKTDVNEKMNLLYPDYNSENKDMILNDPKEE